MRLRIISNPPLPALKAWFSDDSDLLEPSATVLELKAAFCARLHALRDGNFNPHDLALTLEGFELLNESIINVVRDGELIELSLQSGSSRAPLKHKTTLEGPAIVLHKRRRTSPPATNPKSPSSTFAPDFGSSSSASSPSSSRTSSSGYSSSSPVSSMQLPAAASRNAFVTPGHGKPATRRRNLRRRLKRQHANNLGLPFKISATNLQPLGAKTLSEKSKNLRTSMLPFAGAEHASQLTVFGRKKRSNKRVPAKLPQKIVFNSENSAEDVSPDSTTSFIGDHLRLATGTIPLAIPSSTTMVPSLRELRGELPRNMFVTSVDVEQLPRDMQQKGCTLNEDRIRCTAAVQEVGGRDWAQNNNSDNDICNLSATQEHRSFFLRQRLEDEWEHLPKLTKYSQLQIGMLVGWKALGINPSTLTPEVLVHIARICAMQEQDITVLALPILESNNAAIDATHELEITSQEEETFSVNNVLLSDWRHIDF